MEPSARYCVQCGRGSREVLIKPTGTCVECCEKNVAWFREKYGHVCKPSGCE